MRGTRLALSWSAGVMVLGLFAGACATTAPNTADGLRIDRSIVRPTADEMRQAADSARAQAVADEVGPRVTVTADFDYAGGSREVQARFHMYDDAYVVVGHLDAAGRLKIVFPTQPGDDGFVRGDKVYQVPTFFAGFADEYAWRYSEYRNRYHSISSRNDSYDAGLGYVFVIASWRPMRLDRIADGNRWQTYDVSDVSYMQDPREAIEELGSVIAGDNREAYTIEYAHYTTTNGAMYFLSDFDALNSGCYGNLGFEGFAPRSLFFSPFGFLPFSSYGYGGGCGWNYNPYPSTYAYGYGLLGTPVLKGPPGIRPPVGSPPIGSPIFHRPNLPGVVATHKPEGQSVTPMAPMGAASVANGSSAYHRPGLITLDAAPRGQGRSRETEAQMPGVTDRPNIQGMIGRRRIDEVARGVGANGARDNSGWASRQPGFVNRGGNAAATSRPRDEGGTYRTNRGFGAGRSSGYNPPSHAAPSYSTPRYSAPPRVERAEPSHSSPPPRAEPAARPSPPPSSSGSRKP